MQNINNISTPIANRRERVADPREQSLNDLRKNIENIKKSKKCLLADNCLENYYAGDDAWENFAELCKNIKTNNTNELLKLLDNNIELVNVIEWHFRENAINWIYQKNTALNDLRPIDCINDNSLSKRLKECLLRIW